jgi:hypothetical protein
VVTAWPLVRRATYLFAARALKTGTFYFSDRLVRARVKIRRGILVE